MLRTLFIVFIVLLSGTSAFSQNQGQGNAAWKLNGNTPTSGDFIGSVNYMPLLFKTNDLERMRITENGLIGIGTINPSVAFEVIGDTKLSGNLSLGGTFKVDFIEAQTTGGIITIKSGTQFQQKVILDKDMSVSGNTGLGVLNPTERLEVNGNIICSGQVKAAGTAEAPQIELSKYLKLGTNSLFLVAPNTNIGGAIAGANYELYTSDGQDILLQSKSNSGRISVGQRKIVSGAHTDYKFSVDGKAVFQRAVVTTDNWADFVFKKDYQLNTLEDVKSYISEHGHLPNVPSEKEVLNNGVDVAGMDAILLRKIEEITLYLIQLKEENKALKTEIEELKNRH